MADYVMAPRSAAQEMIAASFERRAQEFPELAGALGRGLQALREEGFVAALPERVAALGQVSDLPAGRWHTADLIKTGLVSSDDVAHTPVVLDSGLLYFAVDWRNEIRLAEKLADLACAAPLRQVTPPADLPLGGDQMQALERALNHRLTVIAGGPGTGKTTLVGHLIQTWLAAGGDARRLLIAAPTGRAAARLSASVAELADEPLPPAQTLHRALGWSPSRARFRFDEDHPLPADLIIVDEVSMVDLGLMQALMAALNKDTQLVLLGDKDQLVSVQPGSVMADLCSGLAQGRGQQAIQALTQNFRYAADSGIGQLADAVRRGDHTQALAVLESGEGVQLVDGAPDLDAICGGWLDQNLDGDPALIWPRLLSRRILCAHRTGRAGVDRINAQVFRWLKNQGFVDGRFADPAQPFPGRLFALVGNHYSEGFFNGDQGFLRSEAGELTAFVESSSQALRQLSPSRLPVTEAAYAMTVHRAQGSEFGEVHCVLPGPDSPLLTRELLYTAVTRARQRVVIYADQNTIGAALAAVSGRGSGLTRRLMDLTSRSSDSPIQQSLF